MEQPLIKIINISKCFNKNLLFENINLEIMPKEILGLFGYSGSGKTTFLNILCGFIKPTYGTILYKTKNESISDNYKSIYLQSNIVKSTIGFSSQTPSFYYDLTIIENLKYFGSLYNMKNKELNNKINELLEILDLEKSKSTIGKHLSEGQKKRLDIACAIIHNPQLLILDEPTSNLDYKLRDNLLHYIKKINKNGTAIIFVTHYIKEIENICTKVLLIDKNDYLTVEPKNLKSKIKKFYTEKNNEDNKKEEQTNKKNKEENKEEEQKEKNNTKKKNIRIINENNDLNNLNEELK